MKTWICLMLLAASAAARAEVLLRPALSYSSDTNSSGGVTSTTTRRITDLAAGYVAASGWGLIGMYANENRKSTSGSTSVLTERTGIGAGGGYFSKTGPYIDAVYYLLEAKEEGDGPTYTGDGWQVDAGWSFDVGGVGLGLQLTYRNYNFTKQESVKLSPARKQANLDPMFALVMVF